MGVLRLLLAFSVVLAHSHSFYGFTGMGGSAVPAFFIVSGFYMSLILGEKYQGRLWLFYSNRALRLFPMYWALLFVYFLLAQIKLDIWPISQIAIAARNPVAIAIDGSVGSWAAAIPNLTFLGSDVIRVLIFDLKTGSISPWLPAIAETDSVVGGYRYLIVPPIWSLGVEIVFYALAPFMARLSTRQLIVWLAILCALQTSIFLTATDRLSWYHLLSPYNLCYFAAGMLSQRLWPFFEHQAKGMLLSLMQAIPFAIWFLHQLLATREWSWLVWLVFAACIPALFSLTKQSRFDEKIGSYSYPVYLTHSLFGWAMLPLGEWAGIAAFALSIALSWVLLAAIDEPVERWRQSRIANNEATAVRFPAG
jgi:peptidoglycan/LPS O-acetylase OafA/YrhL